METLKRDFKIDVINYLEGITKDNFGKSYEGLISIIYRYKDKGMLKKDVVEVIIGIDNLPLDENKEEVIIEISNRLHGFCTPSLDINW